MTERSAQQAATVDLGGPEVLQAGRDRNEALRSWFGNSTLVDERGVPRVMYHGTNRDIFEFSTPIVWASADPAHASFYAEAAAELRGEAHGAANVLPVHLSAQRPFNAPEGYVNIRELVGLALKQAAEQGHPISDAEADQYRAGLQQQWNRLGMDDSHVDTHQHWSMVGHGGARLLRDALRGMGFDSIRYEESGFADGRGYTAETVGVFSPHQVKSVTGNRGTFDATNPDLRFSRVDDGPIPMAPSVKVFRSELLLRVLESSTKLADAASWKEFFKGLTRRGVKRDEIVWSGVEEWLDLQGAKVTRDAVVAYLAANGVQVQEVQLEPEGTGMGLDSWLENWADENPGPTADAILDGDSWDETRKVAEREGDEVVLDRLNAKIEPSKYDQYVLPGGTNYREILLTLPVKSTLPEGFSLKQIESGPRKGQWAVIGPGPLPENRYGSGATQEEAIASFGSHGHNGAVYKTPHWDQRNVLVHIRVNDRECVEPLTAEQERDNERRAQLLARADALGREIASASRDTRRVADARREQLRAELMAQVRARQMTLGEANHRLDEASFAARGDDITTKIKERDALMESVPPEHTSRKRRVLFVEEIQSDWAQEGKRRGFATAEQKGATAAALKEADRTGSWSTDPGGYQAMINMKNALPAAPFVDATDKWVALAIRRIVKLAVDGGYDGLAFVTGTQSADRYDLSKQVDRVRVQPMSFAQRSPTLDLTAFKNGDIVVNKEVTRDTLPDFIGKELASKALEALDAGKPADYGGMDLKVGGEGLKGFYDKVVPAVAKRVLKQLGGSGLQTFSLSSGARAFRDGEQWFVDSVDGRTLAANKTHAHALVRQLERRASEQHQIGFSITPEMVRRVSGGVPLFSRVSSEHRAYEGEARSHTHRAESVERPRGAENRAAAATDTSAFRRWFGASKVTDPDGNPLVVYHGSESAGFTVFDASKSGRNTGRDFPGFYFTESSLGASTYSGTRSPVAFTRTRSAEDEPAPGNYAVYLAMSHPLEIDFDGQGWDAEVDGFFGLDEVVRHAKEHGYDGVIASNIVDEGRFGHGYGWDERTFVVFDAGQIKSADQNIGHYNRHDQDIRFRTSKDFHVRSEGHPREPGRRHRSDDELVGMLNRSLHHVPGGEGADSVRPYVASRLPNHEALQQVATALGQRLVGIELRPCLLEAERQRFGFFEGARVYDTVFLSADRVSRPHLAILGHELGHQLRRQKPDLYDRLVQAIRPFVNQDRYATGFATSAIARDSDGHDQIREEFVGEVLADSFLDPSFWRTLGDRRPSLLRRVGGVVRELIAQVESTVERRRATEGYLTDFEKVVALAAEVMADYVISHPQVASAVDRDIARFARAYHGGPHRFERFDTAHVGEGEGAQAQGWGLYFASRRDVAEAYRRGGQHNPRIQYRGEGIVNWALGHRFEALGLPAITQRALAWSRDYSSVREALDMAELHGLRDLVVEIELLHDSGQLQDGHPGFLYEVELPSSEQMLDWDRPVTDQPIEVLAAMRRLGTFDELDVSTSSYIGSLPERAKEAAMKLLDAAQQDLTNGTHDHEWATLQMLAPEVDHNTVHDIHYIREQLGSGADAYRELAANLGGARAASEALLSQGVRGVRYLDGFSRNAGAGTHNFVVFSHEDVVDVKPMFSRRETGSVPRPGTISQVQAEELYRFLAAETVAVGDHLRYELIARKIQRTVDGTAVEWEREVALEWRDAMLESRPKQPPTQTTSSDASFADRERQALVTLQEGRVGNERYQLYLESLAPEERRSKTRISDFNIGYFQFISEMLSRYRRQQSADGKLEGSADEFTRFIRDQSAAHRAQSPDHDNAPTF